MKSLIYLLALFLLAASAPPATAQRTPEVQDGSCYGSGKDVILIQVTEMPNGSVDVTAVSSAGFSSAVTGRRGPRSTPNAATAVSSAIMTLPDGTQLRIDGGEVKVKNSRGKWVKQKKTRGPKKKNSTSAPGPVGNISGSATNPW